MKTILLFMLAMIVLGASAQKNVVIDQDLADNSDPLKVKIGVQTMGKVAKYKFGEYAVTESKNGWTTSHGKSNFWGTREESTTRNKFSFTLGDGKSNTARVNAATDVKVQLKNSLELFSGFYLGDDELQLAEHNFSASIILNNDTTRLWLLFMKKSVGTESDEPGGAVLTNGQRKILIVSATSEQEGKRGQMLPARGYQFREGEQTLSAIQYLGGGMLGMNKSIVWLHKGLDEDTKLVLAAAMTALLQKEMTAITLD
ncbi:hypothetical protein INQ51_17440 [Maribellus sp. CM-23]|uniref:hypothetical protein n=1 Tax=Maribellus sp. CM-23 TaxID=2781026 RepID=UPI001F4703ED|nr:hypothetical protein [Maribellus sp. CM-23]MCE4566107.1 hypothetical protein [Maribellus sp. CM-23]